MSREEDLEKQVLDLEAEIRLLKYSESDLKDVLVTAEDERDQAKDEVEVLLEEQEFYRRLLVDGLGIPEHHLKLVAGQANPLRILVEWAERDAHV